ncbi:MAG: dephospho-CoA kinase [Candidatus Acidiferrales bacterium]
MIRVGLTGGIASGKSTVAGMLRDREFPVLDADALARELLEQGQDAYKEVVAHFGDKILAPSGAVDRRKLAAIVFSDAQQRAKLNQILHPRIRDVVANWFVALDGPGGPELAFEDAALILESGGRGALDRIVVCWCRPEQQLARLRGRGMAEADARARIAAQMPIDEKRKLADETIDCSGSIEETERQIDQIISNLKRG